MQPPPAKNNFIEPQKAVKTIQDMSAWKNSETYYELIGFINSVCTKIQRTTLMDEIQPSGGILNLLSVLNRLIKLAEETPPVQ